MTSSKELELEKRKIVFQFTLMLVAAVIAGICFTRFLGEGTVFGLAQKIYLHFSDKLPQNAALSYFFSTLFRIALPDLICIISLFLFSFSFVNYMVSDAVLVFAGFRFGFNAALIRLAGIYSVGIGNSLSFWLLKGVMLPVLLAFSCKMALYALQLRRFSGANGRFIFNKKATSAMILFTLWICLLSMTANLLYCIFIYIF